MKCARVPLQQRLKPGRTPRAPAAPAAPGASDRVRRFCQQRLVDPAHEDGRWCSELMERFHCNIINEEECSEPDVYQHYEKNTDGVFLSVQTLKFQGDVEERKRPRTCFKYKSVNNEIKHRMFVKQVVEDNKETELQEDASSQITNHYFDDYINYILNDKSRPSTVESDTKTTDKHKEANVNSDKKDNIKSKDTNKKKFIKIDGDLINDYGKTTISYQNSGNKKNLTISRVQSPETVQVIRVDVVCNYSRPESTVESENEDKAKKIVAVKEVKPTPVLDMKSNHFANKYFLTKTIKSLDENLSGGAKVTLLCKTFRLTDRSNLTARCNARTEGNRPTKTKTYYRS
ncbi:unnamed protein product [Plutella xylostella]|uniref:(diamondback moth) hypothetical protein n=1 Tax=Plutella xylostella TaxID=51655 RepID=A0A8S4GCA0_PLUXY|nr:unnamed protein product [Plutella xylostella]